MYFEGWFRKPPKKNRNKGETVSEKTSFRVGMELKKVQTQDRGEKSSRTLPYYGTMPAPLCPPTQCTCITGSLVTHTTKRTRDASAMRWRPERGPASFHSGVGILRLSHPACVCTFFSSIPTRNEVFSETFSPWSDVPSRTGRSVITASETSPSPSEDAFSSKGSGFSSNAGVSGQ